MLQLGDLVRIRTEPKGYHYRERKGIQQPGTITAWKELRDGQLKVELNLNQESFYAIIGAEPEGRTYKGIASNTEELLYTRNMLYPYDEIRITRMNLPAFRKQPLGALVQPFYLNPCKDGRVTNRYGSISLKTGENELFDLETGQIKAIEPETHTGNPSVDLSLFLSADGDRELPDARPNPKMIQGKTRYVYGDLKATFINTIVLHSGCEVRDCIRRRNIFYLTPEKSFLCYLGDERFYDFDRRIIPTLAPADFLIPLRVTAEGKGFQGRKVFRNGNFF